MTRTGKDADWSQLTYRTAAKTGRLTFKVGHEGEMPRYRYDDRTAEAWLAGEYQGCALPPRQPVVYPAGKNLQAQAWRIETAIHTSDHPWRMETGQRDTTTNRLSYVPPVPQGMREHGIWREMQPHNPTRTAVGLNTWDDDERSEFSSATVTLKDHSPKIWMGPTLPGEATKAPDGNARTGLPELLPTLSLDNERDWLGAGTTYGNAIAYVKGGDNQRREIKTDGKWKRHEVPANLRPHKVQEPMVRESGWSPTVDEDDRNGSRGAFRGGDLGAGERVTMLRGFWHISTLWVDPLDGLLEGQAWSVVGICRECGNDLPPRKREYCSAPCRRKADAARKAKKRRLEKGEHVYPRDGRGWYVSPTTTWLLGGPQPPQSRQMYPAKPSLRGGYALKRRLMRGTPRMRMTLAHAGRLRA